jgi:hypothetical protein
LQRREDRNLKSLMRHMQNTMGNTYSAPGKLEKSIFDMR